MTDLDVTRAEDTAEAAALAADATVVIDNAGGRRPRHHAVRGVLNRVADLPWVRRLQGAVVAHRPARARDGVRVLALIHISEPTRLALISYADFCLE
ncbi:hypothetical protein, partial [Nonomuraea aridisoli]|uniref:hypothetical protein n=1 Tax=Nonomuraea aridisoli TaxID=2070368 RepID=UPI001C64EC5F